MYILLNIPNLVRCIAPHSYSCLMSMKLTSSLEDVVVRTAVPVFFLVQGDWGRFVVVVGVALCFPAMTALKNVSSWRLNGAEKAELAQRVAAGEDEATVKRELQTKKAQANEDREAAANAVAAKAQRQTQQAAKAQAKAGVRGAAKAAAPAPPGAQPALDDAALNDAANRSYYLQVQEDIASVLGEFGEEFRAQLQVAVSKSDVDTEQPSNLQMVSPEEMVHPCFAGCAKAIQILGHCIYLAFFLFHHTIIT